MTKIRVGAVSYLNTRPLLYGIRNHSLMNEIELIEDYPSRIAGLLVEGEVDVGLVPVVTIERLEEWRIVSDYCIGSDGEVASVCLFSAVPMEEIGEVYLDYQSETSVMLARILLKEYWKKDVRFVEAGGEDFRERIAGGTAAVVIGDRALEQRLRSPFIYDLGAAWKEHTGLPFVFAAWVANRELPAAFVSAFNEANGAYLDHLDEVIADAPSTVFDLRAYYQDHISYVLDERKKKGMKLFLEKVRDLNKE